MSLDSLMRQQTNYNSYLLPPHYKNTECLSMPKINYIAEHEAFMRYAASNRLRPAERLLWEALFSIFNSRAGGDAWPEGFVNVRSWELEEYTGLGRDSIIGARKSLCARGLICFRPGEGQHLPAGYRIHYISAYGAPEPSEISTVEAAPSGKSTVALSEKSTVPSEFSTVPSEKSTVYREQIDSNIYYKPSPNGVNRMTDGNTDRNTESACAAGDGTVREGFKDAFGRDAYPEELRVILDEGRSPELCVEAMKRAAEMGARYPAKCAAGIMAKWDSRIRTVEDLNRWEMLTRLKESPNPDVAERASGSLRAFFKQLMGYSKLGVRSEERGVKMA